MNSDMTDLKGGDVTMAYLALLVSNLMLFVLADYQQWQ